MKYSLFLNNVKLRSGAQNDVFLIHHFVKGTILIHIYNITINNIFNLSSVVRIGEGKGILSNFLYSRCKVRKCTDSEICENKNISKQTKVKQNMNVINLFYPHGHVIVTTVQ